MQNRAGEVTWGLEHRHGHPQPDFDPIGISPVAVNPSAAVEAAKTRIPKSFAMPWSGVAAE